MCRCFWLGCVCHFVYNAYPVFGINAGGTAAVFKVTEDLEGISRAATIGIHPVDTCSGEKSRDFTTFIPHIM